MTAFPAYFDLRQEPMRNRNASVKTYVVWQYLALALGVIAEPFVHEYIKSQSVQVAFGANVIFGLIIAIIIFPGVYRNAFDPEKPIFVQMCAIFSSGIGWQSLFHAATGGGSGNGDAANQANAIANNSAALVGMIFG